MKTTPDHQPIKPGYYQHYKGPYYQVVDLARHSETNEWLVLYRPMYGELALWARPLSMFTERVEQDDQQVPRFRYIGSKLPT